MALFELKGLKVCATVLRRMASSNTRSEQDAFTWYPRENSLSEPIAQFTECVV